MLFFMQIGEWHISFVLYKEHTQLFALHQNIEFVNLSLEYYIDMGTYASYGILVLCICFIQTYGK